MVIGIVVPGANPEIVRFPFFFQNSYWVLSPIGEELKGSEFRLEGVKLTRAGEELSRILVVDQLSQYIRDLIAFFESRSLQMTRTHSYEPQVVATSAVS